MAEIRVTVDDQAVQSALNHTLSGLENLRPAMKQIGEYMVERTDERFREQRDPDGMPWRPISRQWLQRKQRGYITKILQMRGRLRKSIAYQAERDRVSIGTNVVYGAIHQFGGSITRYAQSRMVNFRVDKSGRSRFAKKKRANFQQAVTYGQTRTTLPARPFLGVNQQDSNEITQIVVDHLSQQAQ